MAIVCTHLARARSFSQAQLYDDDDQQHNQQNSDHRPNQHSTYQYRVANPQINKWYVPLLTMM